MTQPTSDLDKKIEAEFEKWAPISQAWIGGDFHGECMFEAFKAAALPLHQKIAELEAKIDSACEGFEEWFIRHFTEKDLLVWAVDNREDFLATWQASRLSMMKENKDLREALDWATRQIEHPEEIKRVTWEKNEEIRKEFNLDKAEDV